MLKQPAKQSYLWTYLKAEYGRPSFHVAVLVGNPSLLNLVMPLYEVIHLARALSEALCNITALVKTDTLVRPSQAELARHERAVWRACS